ncbi:MAG: extracellular solute-binding protein [Oscillospiraceae bacterium]|nr:extracellular solute-binding protein [Oscillospiraceae bacterium]
MKLKKLLSGLLISAMAVTALTACGGSSDTAVDTSQLTGPARYDEQIEIKIPVYDRGMQGQADVDNNYWTNYVQENFGDEYNIKVTYVPITRKEDVTVFNELLAAGEQPDILFSYDYPTIMSYYSRGAFQPIDEEILQLYAPTFYENTKDLQEYAMADGQLYFLTATRPKAYNWVSIVRTDWLEQAGLDLPQSREEYIEMLRKFKELKLGGEDTIPAAQSLFNAYFPNYASREYPLSEEDNAMYSDITVASLTWEPTKQELLYWNQLYNEGLISPEWMLDKDGSQMQSDFIAGKVGVYGFYLSQTPPVLQSLLENCPDATVAVLPPYSESGDPTAMAGREEWPFGMVAGISKDCEHPEAIMMYYEWLSQPENLFVMQNGIEGVTYNMVDEIPVLVDDYTGTDRLNYNSNKDMWCLVTEGKDYGSEEKNLEAQKKTYAPEGFEDLIQQSYDYYQITKDYMYTDFLFDRSIESLSQYGETLKSKWEVIQVDLITCDPDEFEAKYEAACEEYLSSGYQAVLDEKAEVYQDMTSN